MAAVLVVDHSLFAHAHTSLASPWVGSVLHGVHGVLGLGELFRGKIVRLQLWHTGTQYRSIPIWFQLGLIIEWVVIMLTYSYMIVNRTTINATSLVTPKASNQRVTLYLDVVISRSNVLCWRSSTEFTLGFDNEIGIEDVILTPYLGQYRYILFFSESIFSFNKKSTLDD